MQIIKVTEMNDINGGFKNGGTCNCITQSRNVVQLPCTSTPQNCKSLCWSVYSDFYSWGDQSCVVVDDRY